MTDPVPTDASTLHLLISRLLDWPFLAFVAFLLVARKAGNSIMALADKRKLEIDIAGNKVSIGDAIEALEEDTTRDLKRLVERIDTVEAKSKSATLGEERAGAPGATAKPEMRADQDDVDVGSAIKESDDVVFRRMLSALSDSKFTWRTVERLALLAGVTEREAHEILAAHQGREIRLGKAKSGKAIARLADN